MKIDRVREDDQSLSSPREERDTEIEKSKVSIQRRNCPHVYPSETCTSPWELSTSWFMTRVVPLYMSQFFLITLVFKRTSKL